MAACRLSRKCQKDGTVMPQIIRGFGGCYYYECPKCLKSSHTANSEPLAAAAWNLFQRTAPNLVKSK